MTVKCVFYVAEVTNQRRRQGQDDAGRQGSLRGLHQYTPTGLIEFTSLNDAATQWFVDRIGKDVAITLDDPTEADLITPPIKR